MKKQIGLFLGVLLLIGATGCGKEPQKQVLYENKDLGIGFLMPELNRFLSRATASRTAEDDKAYKTYLLYE